MVPERPETLAEIARQLQKAEQLEVAGQWSDAESVYRGVQQRDVSPASHIALGNFLVRQERYHEAIVTFTNVLDQVSQAGDLRGLAVVHHNLAGIYRELGDADLARRFQQRAIQHQDDCDPMDLLGLANDAWLCQRHELAECLAESSLELDPEECEGVAEARATHGVVSGILDDPRGGIRTLIRVYREHARSNAWRWMGFDLLNLAALCGQIGWSRRELRLVDQAIACLERANAPVSVRRAQQIQAQLRRLQSLRTFDPSRN